MSYGGRWKLCPLTGVSQGPTESDQQPIYWSKFIDAQIRIAELVHIKNPFELHVHAGARS